MSFRRGFECFGLIWLLWTAAVATAAPINDAFANRSTITGSSATMTGTNVAATAQAGEPNNANIIASHSVWWKWTAPASGPVVIDTLGSAYDTTLGVYTGTAFPLTLVGGNDDVPDGIPGEDTVQSYVAFNATANTTYQISVDGWNSATGAILLHVNYTAAPVIDFHPLSVVLNPGAPWTYSVVASGSALTYQWYLNDVALIDGSGFSGTRTANLSIASISATNTGSYKVAVRNALGSATSDTAVLSMYSVPVITAQPVSITRTAGTTASFSVSATGVPAPTYRWRKNGVNLTDGGNVFGATTPTLTLTNVAAGDAGSYTVFVTSSYGNVTSVIATLTVNVPPAISVQPVSLVRTAGTSASFSATVTGTALLSYQWRKNGVALGNGGNVAGATTATLTLTNVAAGDAASYTLVATNAGGTAISNPATLSLNANDLFAAAIALAGSSVSGTGANTTAAAEIGEPAHAGSPATHTVWWRWTAPVTGLATISTAGSSFDTVLGIYTGLSVSALTSVASNDDGGSGGTSLVTFAAVANTVYQIAVDGYQGATGSVALSINVSAAPSVTSVSAARQVVNLGANLTLSATVTGAGATCQWWRNGRAIAGATSAAYTITGALSARDNGWYQLVATNAGGPTKSAPIFVNVVVSPGEIVFKGDRSYNPDVPPAGLTSLSRVAAGSFHVVALKSDGTVAAWGYPYYNVTTVPSTLTNPATANVVSVAAGSSHSLAVKADGTVVAWGYDGYGESSVPAELMNPSLANVVAVSAGVSHSLALRANGTVMAWGSNGYGQTAVPSSLTNAATANIVAVAAGSFHNLALKADGTVVAWGLNNSGQTTMPAGLASVADVAAGAEHSVVLKSDGTVVAWGSNSQGQSTVPGGLTGVAGIAAKYNHTVVYKTGTGAVVAWGSNSYGESTPYAGLDKVVGVSTGAQFMVALRNAAAGGFSSLPVITQQPVNQTVIATQLAGFEVIALAYPSITYQWRKGGVNIAGATGSSYSVTATVADAGSYDVVVTSPAGSVASSPATLVVNPSAAPAITVQPAARQVITAGQSFTLSVTATGTPSPNYVWRRNGRIIDGATSASYSVSAASPLQDNGWYQVDVVSSAGSVTSATSFVNVNVANPILFSVGSNFDAQRTPPANLGLLMAVEGGGSHTLALRTDGTVVAWGGTVAGHGVNYGQSTVPAALTSSATAQVVAITAGLYHSVALKANGTVVAWGAGTTNGAFPHLGQSIVPADLASAATAKVVAVSAGQTHTLVLRADGTVRAWGDNSIGQATVPAVLASASTAHVVAIFAGDDHNIALQADGTVRTWGGNAYGQLNVPASFSQPVVGVSAGRGTSMAVLANGTVAVWGSTYAGQMIVPSGLGNVSLMTGGSSHLVALRADGTMLGWGDNSSGQATMPADITGVFAASAGSFHTVMLRDGDVSWIGVHIDGTVGGNVGDSATFDPTVTGLPAFGTTYQWYRDEDPISAPATVARFVYQPITADDAGVPFFLKATSFPNTQTFGPFYITINGIFTLSLPPSITAFPGDTVTIQPVLGGDSPPTPLNFLWEKDGVELEVYTQNLTLVNFKPADIGRYKVYASRAGQTESASTNVSLVRSGATVTVESLSVSYDGTPKSVTASTLPGGVAVNLTYNGSSTPPTNVGVYPVHGSINDESFQGEGDGTLTIRRADATVAVTPRVVSYDGTAKPVTVTTVPNGLPVIVTYNGSPTVPSSPGHYDVAATVNSSNYTGAGVGSLDITRAVPAVTWSTPTPISLGTALSAMQLNATSLIAGSFTYTPDAGVILGVGTVTLTAIFKPADIANYDNASVQTTLTVVAPPSAIKPIPDFNADGKADLLWRNTGNNEYGAWLMNGTTMAASASYGLPSEWRVIKAADFDGDGKSDLVWRNSTTGAVVLWQMNGTTIGTSTWLYDSGTAWEALIFADFNGDGKTDILWHNTVNGQYAFWLMNGGTIASASGFSIAAGWSVAKAADFNGDGKTDLLWRNASTGGVVMWLQDGTVTTSATWIYDSGIDWAFQVFADFNGDGKTDILWRNATTGQYAFWLMNGSTITSASGFSIAAGWAFAKTADFNGDGKADMIWRNSASGGLVLWLQNGTTTTSSGWIYDSGTAWVFAATKDFNGDGKTDILWQNTVTGEYAFWLMNGLTTLSAAGFSLPAGWVLDQ